MEYEKDRERKQELRRPIEITKNCRRWDMNLQQKIYMDETNELQNSAESAEIQFSLGESTNTHDLQIAQEKANVALQYTVAVRDKVLEAYREIMNMQI